MSLVEIQQELPGLSVAEYFSTLTFVREKCLLVFRQLAENPHQPGDRVSFDRAGREVQHKYFFEWEVSYWTDHPVREVGILALRKA